MGLTYSIEKCHSCDEALFPDREIAVCMDCEMNVCQDCLPNRCPICKYQLCEHLEWCLNEDCKEEYRRWKLKRRVTTLEYLVNDLVDTTNDLATNSVNDFADNNSNTNESGESNNNSNNSMDERFICNRILENLSPEHKLDYLSDNSLIYQSTKRQKSE